MSDQVLQVELQHQHDEITRLRAALAAARADAEALATALEDAIDNYYMPPEPKSWIDALAAYRAKHPKP